MGPQLRLLVCLAVLANAAPAAADAPKRLLLGCFGWSQRAHDAVCLRGQRIAGDGAMDITAGFLNGDDIQLSRCGDDKARFAGIDCDLDVDAAKRLRALWRDAGTTPLTAMALLKAGKEVAITPNAHLRRAHKWMPPQRRPYPTPDDDEIDPPQPWLDDSITLRCNQREQKIIANDVMNTEHVDARWKLVDEHWLVVSYHGYLGDKTPQPSADAVWDAAVIDLDAFCAAPAPGTPEHHAAAGP